MIVSPSTEHPESGPQIPVVSPVGPDGDRHVVVNQHSTVLGMPRFAAAAERRFRAAFAAAGAQTRRELQAAAVALLAVIAVIELTTAHRPLNGVTLVAVLGLAMAAQVGSYLWGRRPDRRDSVLGLIVFVMASSITLVCVLVVHVAGAIAGHSDIPLIVLTGLILGILLARLTFPVALTITVAYSATVDVAEYLAVGQLPHELADVTVSVTVVAIATATAWEREFVSRVRWSQERRIAMLNESDPLTRIANRMHFATSLSDAVDAEVPITVFVADVGGFKQYNDDHGHPAGDEVLRAVALCLQEATGDDEALVARIAGKRFAVLWRATGTRADELRRTVAATLDMIAGPQDRLSAAAGVAEWHPDEHAIGAAELLQRAEGALVLAKRSGGDRLVVARPGDRVPLVTAPHLDDDPAHSGPQHPCPHPLRVTWRSLSFATAAEAAFRTEFDEEALRARAMVLLGVVIMSVGTLLIGRSFVGIPGAAMTVLTPTLLGVQIPVALAGLTALALPALRRWSAPIFLAVIVVCWAAVVVDNAILTTRDADVIPVIAPVSLILSVAMAHIVMRLAVPAGVGMMVVTVGAELAAGPLTPLRLFTALAAATMCVLAIRSAFRLEHLHRIRWRRSQHLAFLSQTDLLTKLVNRRGFEARLHGLITTGRDITLMLLDIDSFGAYNRTFGYASGDACLQRIGRYLAASGTDDVVVARVGGEEFAVVIADRQADAACALARSIWAGLPGLQIPAATAGVVTASAGVAVHAAATPEIDARAVADQLFAEADCALYRAKRAGRNQLRFAATDHRERAVG
ncbi:MAG: diguanylate cyclase [Gordonia sp. (in: high G+C Gram-positive bacteria)]